MNDYSFHAAMLADPSARIPINEEEPQPGRYRHRRNGSWTPVAIWHDESGVLFFLSNGEFINDPQMRSHIWTSCAKHAISENEYERLMSGANEFDPVYAALPDDAAKLRARVEKIATIPFVIDDADTARYFADAAHLLKSIETRCNETLKDEKAPLEEKLNALKAKWGEPAELAKAVREPLMNALTKHLKTKNTPGGVKGQAGRSISLRKYDRLEITDYEAALAHFVEKDPEAFRKTVEKLARAALKTGKVPGAKFVEDKRTQ